MSTAENQTRAGVLFAIAAYSMWGFAPMYFKLLEFMPAMEILVHRIVWSAVVLVLLIALRYQWPKVKLALASKKSDAKLVGCRHFTGCKLAPIYLGGQ
jgi:chloramphenicol-sensitive protein RarD